MPNPYRTPVSQLRYSKSVTTPIKRLVNVPTSCEVSTMPKWAISYTNLTRELAETYLNISIDKLPIVPIEEMLGPIPKISKALKTMVYKKLVDPFVADERYSPPPGFSWKVHSRGDLVSFAILPVLSSIANTFELQVGFYRTQAIDQEFQELEGMNLIQFLEERYILVIEAKQDNTYLVGTQTTFDEHEGRGKAQRPG